MGELHMSAHRTGGSGRLLLHAVLLSAGVHLHAAFRLVDFDVTEIDE